MSVSLAPARPANQSAHLQLDDVTARQLTVHNLSARRQQRRQRHLAGKIRLIAAAVAEVKKMMMMTENGNTNDDNCVAATATSLWLRAKLYR